MSRASRAGRAGPILAILAVVLCGAAFLFFFNRSYPLERSAIGFEGLKTWLARSGVTVRRLPPASDDPESWTTLRVLPLYDNDMSDTLVSSADDEDTRRRLGPLSPRDMSRQAFERRVAKGMTLVVLPKWRGGIVTRGRAHPDLLIPLGDIWFFDVADVLRRPGGDPIREWKIVDAVGDRSPGSVALYAPQVLGPGLDDGCDPLWRVDGVGVLLAWCDALSEDAGGFFVLSDPDLLDNHGLSLGDNAGMAIEMMRLVAPGGPVYVDPGGDAVPGEGASALGEPEESFADPSRFFRYPFSLVWLGVGLMLLLALWRGNVRFGLPRAPATFRGFQSKRDTIRASGRLMRLAGGEGELTRAYAVARMEALSDTLLGKGARAFAPADPAGAVLRFLGHRAPDLGTRMNRAYRDLTTGELSGKHGFAALGAFESAFQEILDEFGRTSLPPRRDRA